MFDCMACKLISHLVALTDSWTGGELRAGELGHGDRAAVCVVGGRNQTGHHLDGGRVDLNIAIE